MLIHFGSRTHRSVGTVKDLWATGFRAPAADRRQSFSATKTTNASTKATTFVVTRALDTGDAAQDAKLECGKDYSFEWVGNSSGSSMQMHNKDGSYSINVENCESGAMNIAISTVTLVAAVASSLY